MNNLLKKLNTKVGVLFSISLVIAGALSPTIFAQNQPATGTFNFSTTPIVASLDVKPGKTVSTKVQLKNNGLSTEKIKVGLLKLSSNDKDGAPVLKDTEVNDDFVNWVKFSEDTFDAEPDVWKTIDVTVSAPATAAFGYYYAINFSRINGAQNQGSPTNISASIAVPLLLDVTAPGAVRNADITNFSVNKNVFEFLPATFNVTLKNSGNTHVAPRGNVFITKGGKNVGLIEVNKGKGNILPSSVRQFSSDWNDGSPAYVLKEVDGKPVTDKDGNRVYTLSWSKFDAGKLRFGKYHAKIAMVYDDGRGDVSTEAELDFWVIPWRILGVLLVVLLFIGAGLWATLLKPLRSRIRTHKGKQRASNHE